MRILSVEDTLLTRTMLDRALRKWGYDAVSVDNIDDALEIVSRDSIQFVLTDWIMPGGDGPTLCRRIRALNLPFYTYIILVTSLDDAQSVVEGIESGADDFIRKPVQLDELHARIRAGERILRLERTLHESNHRLSALSEQLLAAQEVINRDLQMAGKMQRGLLPTNSTSTQGVSIDWLFRPSTQVSGDIFNFFRLDEHQIGFYIIDVAGHGIAAAMQSFTLSRLLTPDVNRANPLKCRVPEPPFYEIARPTAAVIDELNQRFQTDAVNTLYFTMIYGVIDTRSQLIDLCQAGHPHPLLLSRGEAARFVGENGLPVGITPLATYESSLLTYRTGDRLFFYSDGITECESAAGEMFGPERLRAFVEETRSLPLGEVLQQLDERMHLWRGGDAFEDDISILVLEMSGA